MINLQELIQKSRDRQTDITRKDKDYAIYYGKEHDLLIALPHTGRLTKNYKIYFPKDKSMYSIMTIYSGSYTYKILFNNRQLLFNENGYYSIMGKYPQQKGLHKMPIHRLAYIAFFGNPPPGYHIHHIDRDKHNNSMDNLVALSESEHSQVHRRVVSVGRNLFNAPKQPNLLSELSKEKQLASNRPPEYEEPLIYQIENMVQPTIKELLEREPTRETLELLVKLVIEKEEETALDYLCRIYLSTEDFK